MKDISNRQDIEFLVSTFYEQLLLDELMHPFFEELDLDHHLPVICDFWESILLGNIVYRSNAMEKHLQLNESRPIRKEHFISWIDHWQKTVDTHFRGSTAKEAKRRAGMVAKLMEYKINQSGQIGRM
ncbi:MAG: group III truncated hemoglobin [Bacteroidota bacterium]